MKLTKLSLAMIAAAGLLSLAPSVLAQDATPPAAPPAAKRAGGGRMSPEAQLKDLTDKLTLTAEQQPKVKAILEERVKGLQAARALPAEDRQAQMKMLHEEIMKKMKVILTPDQFTKYEALQKSGPGAGKKKKTE